MEITDIRIKLIENDQKNLRGVASITLNNVFVIHDIKIVESTNGLFVAMPSKKDTRGEYKDIAHPLDTATRREVSDKVLQKYEEALALRNTDE